VDLMGRCDTKPTLVARASAATGHLLMLIQVKNLSGRGLVGPFNRKA